MRLLIFILFIYTMSSCSSEKHDTQKPKNLNITDFDAAIDSTEQVIKVYQVSFSYSETDILNMDSLHIYLNYQDTTIRKEYSMKHDIYIIYDSIFSLGGERFTEDVDLLCVWTDSNSDSIFRKYTDIVVGYEKVYKDSLFCLESYRFDSVLYLDRRFRIDGS